MRTSENYISSIVFTSLLALEKRSFPFYTTNLRAYFILDYAKKDPKKNQILVSRQSTNITNPVIY